VVKVLDGIRVVSLAINLPGPLAAARLAELGATVIKVEPPSGDPLAHVAPSWYRKLSAGQKILTLDLKAPQDRAELDVLLKDADILLTANRPSALRRLGLLDAGDRPNPRLSHVEIVGHDGDREETPGHDLNYQAAHGTLHAANMPLAPIADLLGAERAVQGALVAILTTSRSGKGSHQRVVLEDAAFDAGAAARNGLTGTGTPLGGAMPTYATYATLDGYVALGAIEPIFRQRTLALMDVQDNTAALAAVFATKTAGEWEALGVAHDIPLTAVRTATRHEP